MNIGDKITLKGKSLHGKNRTNQFGSDWEVEKIRDSIMTTKHQGRRGPFLSIRPLRKIEVTYNSRWISSIDDPDFEIIKKKV